ncbi:hypothetical protein B0H17DRAFT_1209635 [Mycena rosella]|uniref:Uncharacterized protein n=1 Tax=Mycena rosella TaxID=1033263 RepID=A0AAD7D1W0_MYCRO|nr:hypothetical protein B0H17DRAFT_1209635 [Mycena rosella]
MARTKNVRPKEMFKRYDPDSVPETIPFPELARVATTKGKEAAVPTLNEHQRSWILDVGVRDVDLPGLKGKAASHFYDRLKNNAFDAKAFLHKVQSQDRAEEAALPALVAAWKQKNKKESSGTADDGDTSDQEADEGGRAALLRGYSKAGWRIAIQKVISNKRSADSRRRKAKQDDAGGSTHAGGSTPEAPALSKLLGLAAYTGRDKFRDDRHNVIYELSTTLPGANAGGKFRKAEGLLWAKEDQVSWEAAAAVVEDIDWAERQKLVASGFKHMVDSLHASHKFRPFVATMLMAWLSEEGQVQFEAEAVPDDICVGQKFKQLNAQLVKDSVVAMHAWAEKPLTEYVATREASVKDTRPIFPLSAEALDDVTPKILTQTVTTFLAESYEAVFGAGDIPWAAIASAPDDFYDAAQPPLRFTATGLAGLTRPQCYDLASTLVSVAGAGTSGFFRKAHAAQAPPSRSPTPPPPRTPTPARSPTPAAAAYSDASTLANAAAAAYSDASTLANAASAAAAAAASSY